MKNVKTNFSEFLIAISILLLAIGNLIQSVNISNLNQRIDTLETLILTNVERGKG